MNFAFILQLFQFFGCFARELGRQILRIYLVKASIQTKGTLLKCTHFLEAKRHIVHRHLDQEPVFGIFLELKPVQQGLGLLKKT